MDPAWLLAGFSDFFFSQPQAEISGPEEPQSSVGLSAIATCSLSAMGCS